MGVIKKSKKLIDLKNLAMSVERIDKNTKNILIS